MGSLILCHEKKAKHAYEISRIHKKIFTIEELCYYLCNNLYLIDYTIMNEQLCAWLEEEIELVQLAEELRELIIKHCSVEHFAIAILSFSEIYTAVEMNHIRDVLDKLKNQKDIERQKYKGDNLLENNEVEDAILVYQSILKNEKDETVDIKFYGKLYGCLGTAYGRLFLYREAMEMFDIAFQITSEPSMLRAYIYAASQALPRAEYEMLLGKSEVFVEIDEDLQQLIEVKNDHVKNTFKMSEELLNRWKMQYRRS